MNKITLKQEIQSRMTKGKRSGTTMDLLVALKEVQEEKTEKYCNAYNAIDVAKMSPESLALYAEQVRDMLRESAVLTSCFATVLRDIMRVVVQCDVDRMKAGKEPLFKDFLMSGVRLVQQGENNDNQ